MNSESKKFIVCDPSKCVGCEICMQACSAAKEDGFNIIYSRIHTVHLGTFNEPILNLSIACHHCEDPPCVRACPREALTQDDETGVIKANTDFEDPNSCHVPCGWCVAACEFGAIIMHPGYKKTPAYESTTVAVACDLCPDDLVDGEPPCVRSCPKDALSLASIEEVVDKTESSITEALLDELGQAREESKTFYERFGISPIPPKVKEKQT